MAETGLITQAYDELIDREEELLAQNVTITDDAMLVERYTDVPVKMAMGAYTNIKITTPEDMGIAAQYL